MNDPKRLSEGSKSDVERLLLRAGRARAPQGAKQRAMVVASGAMAASGLATAGAAAEGAAAATKIGSIAAAKWIAVLSVASAGSLTGAAVLHRANERAKASAVEGANAHPARIAHGTAGQHALVPASPRSPPALAVSIVQPAPPAPAESSNAQLGGATAAEVPSNEGTAVEPARAASRIESALGKSKVDAITAPNENRRPLIPLLESAIPAVPAESLVPARPMQPSLPVASTLHAELGTIDQARAALHSGDTRSALGLLDHYEARFPRGAMAPEAAVLRVEVLVKGGDRLGAKRVADAFLASNPQSPYAPRIQWLLLRSNP
jgi:TolA-binding protein